MTKNVRPESFQAIADFTDVLNSQGSEDESGTSVVASKLKLLDFSGNDPTEIDSDEIIMQLAESEGWCRTCPSLKQAVRAHL